MTNLNLSNTEVVSISLLVAWTVFWKGFALWKAATERDKVWYVVLLAINTLGVLEILYIFVFSKRQQPKPHD